MDDWLRPFELSERLDTAAIALRGYNTTNLGRTPELLAHRTYGPVLARWLTEASGVCREITGQPVDLVARVKARRESTLDTFGEDIGLIIAVELAQLELLGVLFDIEFREAKLALGYSLGEIAALVAGGVLTMRDALRPLITMAADCAALAADITMGVVFSRGPALDLPVLERLVLHITQHGHGVLAISAYLSPNTILVLGQGDTVDRFKNRLGEALDGAGHLRKNQERWPPLHTPIVWQRSVSNRAAIMMQTMSGGLAAPQPPIISLVTGKPSYNDYNCREILNRWIDHPQRLWDGVYELLAAGIETVLHIGPAPNLLPATFKRLSDNVSAQISGRSLNSLSMRALSGMVGRPWLAKLLSARAALLRAPFVRHVIVEDWLLAQETR